MNFFLLFKVWVAILSFIYWIIILLSHFSTHHRGWFPKGIFRFNFSVIWINCIFHILCLVLIPAYWLMIQCHIEHFFFNIWLHRVKVITIFVSLVIKLISFIFWQIKWYFRSWWWWIRTKRCSKIHLLFIYHHCVLNLFFNFSFFVS